MYQSAAERSKVKFAKIHIDPCRSAACSSLHNQPKDHATAPFTETPIMLQEICAVLLLCLLSKLRERKVFHDSLHAELCVGIVNFKNIEFGNCKFYFQHVAFVNYVASRRVT